MAEENRRSSSKPEQIEIIVPAAGVMINSRRCYTLSLLYWVCRKTSCPAAPR
jgi:hypothetical protein